jgi:acyl-CoA reductase-like NAD-dependent aldehyde dehydrogenase
MKVLHMSPRSEQGNSDFSAPGGLFIQGQWIDGDSKIEVRNKFTNEVIGTVASAGTSHLESALVSSKKASGTLAAMPAYRRSEILVKASALILESKERLADCIARESGKALKFARLEVERAVDTFRLAGHEAERLHGETVPMDAVKSGEGFIGFWRRRPVGVIAAITPFNFPLNLVAHKVAPAFASGNAVILKPSELTPFTAALLCEILMEAGVPDGGINLIHGTGEKVADPLIRDSRVDKVTFTGSAAVGRRILSAAGIKKVTLELGNSSPVVIARDANLRLAAAKCAIGANYCSGQVCISTQRIFVDASVAVEFTAMLKEETAKLIVGDPLNEIVDVGPMIRQTEAERVESWVAEAVQGGARLVLGGRREGSVYWPTILDKVTPEMRVVREEVFGPVVSIQTFEDFEDALTMADDTEYGLQASVFTQDIDRAFRAAARLNFGGVIINDTPHLRPDHIPYGGNRQSGLGREGLRYAMEEMTNIQMIMIRTPAHGLGQGSGK